MPLLPDCVHDSDPLALDATDPAAVYAAYGLMALAPLCGWEGAHIEVVRDERSWRQTVMVRLPDDAVWPDIAYIGDAHEDGDTPFRLRVAGQALALAGHLRPIYQTMAHADGTGYIWPPLRTRTAWKPWAGKLVLSAHGPALVAELAHLAGRPIRDILHITGAGYHDWSGLDPLRSASSQDIGFSPNDHREIRWVGRPVLTLLAMIGLDRVPVARVSEPGEPGSLLYPVWWPAGDAPLDTLGQWPQEICVPQPVDIDPPAVYAADIVWRSQYLGSVTYGRPAQFVPLALPGLASVPSRPAPPRLPAMAPKTAGEALYTELDRLSRLEKIAAALEPHIPRTDDTLLLIQELLHLMGERPKRRWRKGV